MKYIKTYEDKKYGYNNIVEKDGKLHIYVYQLAKEMEESVVQNNKSALNPFAIKEKEFVNLVRKLLVGKVISFSCGDCYPWTWHTGVCDYVDFDSDFLGEDKNGFMINFISIKLEDFREPHSIDIDEIIVDLNIDADTFRNANKYNL